MRAGTVRKRCRWSLRPGGGQYGACQALRWQTRRCRGSKETQRAGTFGGRMLDGSGEKARGGQMGITRLRRVWGVSRALSWSTGKGVFPPSLLISWWIADCTVLEVFIPILDLKCNAGRCVSLFLHIIPRYISASDTLPDIPATTTPLLAPHIYFNAPTFSRIFIMLPLVPSHQRTGISDMTGFER